MCGWHIRPKGRGLERVTGGEAFPDQRKRCRAARSARTVPAILAGPEWRKARQSAVPHAPSAPRAAPSLRVRVGCRRRRCDADREQAGAAGPRESRPAYVCVSCSHSVCGYQMLTICQVFSCSRISSGRRSRGRQLAVSLCTSCWASCCEPSLSWLALEGEAWRPPLRRNRRAEETAMATIDRSSRSSIERADVNAHGNQFIKFRTPNNRDQN